MRQPHPFTLFSGPESRFFEERLRYIEVPVPGRSLSVYILSCSLRSSGLSSITHRYCEFRRAV